MKEMKYNFYLARVERIKLLPGIFSGKGGN